MQCWHVSIVEMFLYPEGPPFSKWQQCEICVALTNFFPCNQIGTHIGISMSARTSHRHPFIFHSFVQPNPNNPYTASKFKSLPERIGKCCAHKPKCCHKHKCAANKAIPLRVGPCNTWKTSTHTFGDNHTRLSQCLLCLYAFVPLVSVHVLRV